MQVATLTVVRDLRPEDWPEVAEISDRIAKLAGVWRDTVFLERRSERAGR